MLLFFLAAALTVRQDGAELRSGCEARDAVVTKLPAGSPVEIRFALAGAAAPCYKVSVLVDGKSVTGYLGAASIAGLESFEQSRRSAPTLDLSTMTSSIPQPKPGVAPNHPMVLATDALRNGQPAKALEIAERAMKVTGRDRTFLLIAGISAYQADDAKKGLAYLKEAQELQDDPAVASWIERIQREVKGDQSGERLYGSRFLLRYEGGKLDPDIARAMVGILDEEYSRVSLQLGCAAEDRIVTIVQSREAYRATTASMEWSGGQFDGKIRVPVSDSRTMSPETRRVFAHEIVHACLASLGQWPAWVQEGLAQKFSGDSMTAAKRELLRSAFHGKPPQLGQLGSSFSAMNRQNAEVAYAYALLAAETLVTEFHGYGIRNVLRAPERLPQVEAELDKVLAGLTR